MLGESSLVDALRTEKQMQEMLNSTRKPSLFTVSASASTTYTVPDPPKCSAIARLSPEEFSLLLQQLQRMSWAAAGGCLYALTAELSHSTAGSGHQRSALFGIGTRPDMRTSESSTGSNESDLPSSLHAAVCNASESVSNEDTVEIRI